MAQSNYERVGKALELLKTGLQPFFERELHAAYGDGWEDQVVNQLGEPRRYGERANQPNWDTSAMLSAMAIPPVWNDVFGRTLSRSDRNLVHELRDVRNSWAHQKSFNLEDTYRALDSVQRLLTAVSAAKEAAEIERQKQDVLRLRFDEQARRETRKAAVAPIEGQPAGGLHPWREIITPHQDVASGRYQAAEFAADLNQVYQHEGADEYRDPQAFFQRTYLTEGLKQLLANALRRLSGAGGDPVIELQTNFGGGKTHSMLALYHLFGGSASGELLGIDTVMEVAGVAALPQVQRAVLVGTALSPAMPHRTQSGLTINTLWGLLAWQLLGNDGYTLVADADRQGISPGSDVLRTLFTAAAPCLILIDEWVAYARQLYVHPDDKDKSTKRNLPGGTFEANMTFAQSLTEAAKAAPKTLVVASIPASDIEIGGEAGQEALVRLRNTFGRVESAWRPATAEEGFAIVRRRLFQPIPTEAYPARDAVVKAFMDLYNTQSADFPPVCREKDYERRLKEAYPIHPELFDRLNNDWGALDRFQRTRGVLRLMAGVIHELWRRDDRSLLILPSSIPLDETVIQTELARYLDDPWKVVIEKDVDGPYALPLQIDRDNPSYGRYSACRRVARTLFMGSGATAHLTRKGLEDRQIKLGCVQPGESVATFGDALRRLTDQATHLYLDGSRYWFSTQPSVNRLAQDRATQQTEDAVFEEILKRLRDEQRQRGDFAAMHIAPGSNADVPDERDTRLVVLGPAFPHAAKSADSAARTEAQRMLESRGLTPRRFRNTLVFLAPDTNRLKDLTQAVSQFLAWKSIDDEKDTLNLDAFQASQTRTKRQQAEETVRQRIPETYIWLLVPEQPDPQGVPDWQESRVQGPDPLAVRASKKLRNEELLITSMAGTRLRMELDRVPLWRDEQVPVRQLADDFAQYLYLPRLRDPDVLLRAIEDGLPRFSWEQETFAYADGTDSASRRYRGLRAGESGTARLDAESLLVHPRAARQQLDIEEEERRQQEARRTGERERQGTGTIGGTTGNNGDEPGKKPITKEPLPTRKARRFHGAVQLPAMRMGRDAGTIADAVVQHLESLIGTRVRITLEIEADIPDGAPDHVVRTVTENCRTLKFETFGFEEE